MNRLSQEPVVIWIIGPMGEPTTITLLNGHSVKMTSNDLALWS